MCHDEVRRCQRPSGWLVNPNRYWAEVFFALPPHCLTDWSTLLPPPALMVAGNGEGQLCKRDAEKMNKSSTLRQEVINLRVLSFTAHRQQPQRENPGMKSLQKHKLHKRLSMIHGEWLSSWSLSVCRSDDNHSCAAAWKWYHAHRLLLVIQIFQSDALQLSHKLFQWPNEEGTREGDHP